MNYQVCPHCGRNVEQEGFDPMTDVPKDDEQAKIAIAYSGGLGAQATLGIYHARRAQGDSVLDAYEKALQARLASYQNKEV